MRCVAEVFDEVQTEDADETLAHVMSELVGHRESRRRRVDHALVE